MSKNRLPKATQAIKQKRLERVLELRGRGKMRFQCIGILVEEWGMSETGVQKYWDATNVLLKEGFTDEDLINSYTYIRDTNLDKNPAIAVKCNDSIAKLKKGGFNAPVKNDIVIRFDDESREGKQD